ncbi:MAG: septum formation initiator family protein, partial [Tissierellales bacterium]
VFYLSKTVISQSIYMKELKETKLKEEQEIVELEKEIEQLQEQIDKRGSLEFIEKVAREELNLVKPREMIYIDINKQKDNKNIFQQFTK